MCRRGMCAGTLSLARRLSSVAGRGKSWLRGGARHPLEAVGRGLLAAGHRLVDARAGHADLRAQVARLALDPATVAAHLALHARPVATDDALDAVAALTQLPLHARAGLLELALDPVARGGAAALEPAQVALDLALHGVAVEVGLGRVDHVVAGDQGRADRDQQRPPGVVLGLLERRALVELASRGGALGGGASPASIGAAGGGGLLGGGRPGGGGGGGAHGW